MNKKTMYFLQMNKKIVRVELKMSNRSFLKDIFKEKDQIYFNKFLIIKFFDK